MSRTGRRAWRSVLAGALAALVIVAGSSGCGETPSTPPEAPASTTESPAASPDPPDATAGAEQQAGGAGDSGDGADATEGAAAGGSADGTSAESDGAVDPAGPTGLDPDTEDRLVALLDELEGLARDWDPAGRASLAIVAADGTAYGFNEDRQHISASAVKPVWTAAAIHLAGLAAVEPLAEAALVQSDNFAAGAIIDLIGIDTVNAWSRDVAGMTGTHLAAWYFGTDRVAQSVTEGGTRANFTTVGDLARFYAGVRRGELLDDDGVAALEAWLRHTDRGISADEAVTGVLLARLPEDVAAAATHKAGWLPPYCCSAEVRLVMDAGVIPLPGGSWFAIAAVSDRGDYYNLSVRWVSLAACRVYALLAGEDSHDCDRSGDGVPRPDLWLPAPEPEPEADEAEEPPSGPDEAEALPIEPDEDEESPPEPGEDEDLPPELDEVGEVPPAAGETDEADLPPDDGASDGTGSETPAPEPAGSEPGG